MLDRRRAGVQLWHVRVQSGQSSSAVRVDLEVHGHERVDGTVRERRRNDGRSVVGPLRVVVALADNLGVAFPLLPTAGLQDAFDAALAPVFVGTDPGLAEENVQSRARGVLADDARSTRAPNCSRWGASCSSAWWGSRRFGGITSWRCWPRSCSGRRPAWRIE